MLRRGGYPRKNIRPIGQAGSCIPGQASPVEQLGGRQVELDFKAPHNTQLKRSGYFMLIAIIAISIK